MLTVKLKTKTLFFVYLVTTGALFFLNELKKKIQSPWDIVVKWDLLIQKQIQCTVYYIFVIHFISNFRRKFKNVSIVSVNVPVPQANFSQTSQLPSPGRATIKTTLTHYLLTQKQTPFLKFTFKILNRNEANRK